MSKKSFIIHIDSLDVLNDLNDEQSAQLFRAIRNYHTGEEVELTGLMKAVFTPFKNQFDRDLKKYKDISEKNKQNARKRWDKKNATASDRIRNDAKNADNDSDSENDSGNDNKNDNGLLKTENTNLDEVDIEDGNTDLSIVQKIIPPKQHYLDLYNRAKTKFKGGHSFAKNLNTQDSEIKDNFEFVYSNYKVRDLKFALKGLFIQVDCMDSIFTTHHVFKDNKFETYRDAGINEVKTLYSTKKKQFKQQEL